MKLSKHRHAPVLLRYVYFPSVGRRLNCFDAGSVSVGALCFVTGFVPPASHNREVSTADSKYVRTLLARRFSIRRLLSTVTDFLRGPRGSTSVTGQRYGLANIPAND